MNRLSHETSPYLLQHQANPVDWYAWGPEALARAKQENKPIFLSIGYSACHWCHVMEHESFENAAIAGLMNEHFVNIKVDREERPDLDHIYMSAVQLLTGRGGWPMSVFLTPDLQPFYGGTYWPPTPRMGMPGFDQVLMGVAEAWQNRREEVVAHGAELTQHVAQFAALPAGQEPPSQRLVDQAGAALERNFDFRHGGFGGAPKFPHPMDLQVLLRLWKRSGGTGIASGTQHSGTQHSAAQHSGTQHSGTRHSAAQHSATQHSGTQHIGTASGTRRSGILDMVTTTLERMAAGGIYDHLGGGFHRYSVDERWLVPHFEKMLYDNALLTACYVEAFQATGNAEYARVARETCDYVLRDLTDPAGGFYSTEDADSEGEEGKFYVWRPEEVAAVLGPDNAAVLGPNDSAAVLGQKITAADFCYVYDVSEPGNFEGHNILNMPKPLEVCAKLRGRDVEELRSELATARAKLLEERNKRVRPGRDDKVLVAWNGLMIDALARAGGALDERRYIAAAVKAADFILHAMRRPDGRLLHTWRAGQAKFDAYLDDYAALANALVSLYEATFDERWIDEAARLVEIMLGHFADAAVGGFFYTADDHEQLIARHKDVQDSSVPSGNALAATVLVRLGKLTGRADYLEAAQKTIRLAGALLERAPTASGQMLLALETLLGPTHEIVLLGDPSGTDIAAVLKDLRRRFMPNKVVALRSGAAKGKNAGQAPRLNETSVLLDPLFAGKTALSAGPTLYICENFTCQAPVTGRDAAIEAISRLGST